MIKRIVKMSFQPEELETFLTVFNESKPYIAKAEGCLHLELMQMPATPNVIFTFSFWRSETDLNNYRHSELFAKTWAKTKVLFNDKPQAWTVTSLEIVKQFEK